MFCKQLWKERFCRRSCGPFSFITYGFVQSPEPRRPKSSMSLKHVEGIPDAQFQLSYGGRVDGAFLE